MTGISFIDSTSVSVCHIKRAKAHKTFKGLASWGKSSVGWYFDFKLHLIINDYGELLAVALTPGNTDDREPVPEMTQDLVGKLFGDRGYISQALFESLFERGLSGAENSWQSQHENVTTLANSMRQSKASRLH